MAFKFVAFFGLLALANAGLLPVAHHGGAYISAPAVHHVDVGHFDGHHEPAHYDFSYSVHDPHTGDIKEQQETRQGHSVAGHYSLVEPDGHRRTVHYTADEHHGFNAHVTREGSNVHVQHAPVAVAHHAAPIAIHAHHAAPVAIAHHAAPVAIAHHAVAHHAAPVAIAHHAVAHHAAPLAYAHHAAPVAIAHHAAPIAIASHGIALGHSAGHGVATSHSSVTHHDVHGVHGYHH